MIRQRLEKEQGIRMIKVTSAKGDRCHYKGQRKQSNKVNVHVARYTKSYITKLGNKHIT